MIKKTPFQLLLILMTGAVFLAACKKDDGDAAKQAEIDEQIILDYIAANNIAAQRHESGLYYLITKEGTGEHPEISSTIEIFYKGYLTNGNVFDQTTHGSVVFSLQNLIKGWKIGIPLLKAGGSGIFLLPSALGYGASGSGSIPPNAVLIFEIDLVAVQ